MKKPPYAKHLTDNECKILFQVYANHNSSMGLKERVKYSASNIVKVKRNLNEKCLEVYYDNGEWWKYYPDGTWG